jgi:hypothetical protein
MSIFNCIMMNVDVYTEHIYINYYMNLIKSLTGRLYPFILEELEFTQ